MTDELREMARELADDWFFQPSAQHAGLLEAVHALLLRAKEAGEREATERAAKIAEAHMLAGSKIYPIGDILDTHKDACAGVARAIRQDTGRG